MSLFETVRTLVPGAGETTAWGTAPEDSIRRTLALLHGLLLVFTAYAILYASSGVFEMRSLIIFFLAGAMQVLVYFLPEGFASNRRHQRFFVVFAVTVTASWLVPLCIGAGPRMWMSVAVVVTLPLIMDGILPWLACTAAAIAVALTGPRPEWLAADAGLWEIEFLVVELSLIGWVSFALMFDNVELTARLRSTLADERNQARVVSRTASSLLAATDVHEVFRGVTQALNDGLQVERCLMVRADPLRKAASLVAMSGNWDSDTASVDLSEESPLHAALTSGQVLYIHNGSGNSTRDTVIITANSGLGMPLLICCEAERRCLEPATLRLIENVAEAAVRTIKNVQLLGATREKAQTDPLTGLPNRRAFQTNLRREFERAQRHERPLSLLMIDLDFLKSINDEHGHPVGDSVIRTAAEQIVAASRGSDYLAARYGGEEFAVILPETDLEGAVAAAERICEAISETELPTVGHFTASLGAACYPVNASTQLDLLETADAALYDAKRAGRNQVVASVNHTLI